MTENGPSSIAATAADNDDPIIFLRVAVGSTNPAKIRAVEYAFRHTLKSEERKKVRNSRVELAIQGFDVDSGVSDQPFGDKETCLGAKNRAKAAYMGYLKAEGKAPHLAVGLEGGLEWRTCLHNGHGEKKDLYCMAWMSLYGRREPFTVDLFASPETKTYWGDKKPIFGLSKTASFALPTQISQLVEQGMELGDADDKVFDRVNSKHGSGTVGILTDGLIDRAEYYQQSLILALTPWIRPDLYTEGLL